MKKDFDVDTLTPYLTNVPINRTEHPYRYLAVLEYLFYPDALSDGNANKKPIINPPKPEPRDNMITQALGRLGKLISLFAKIAPLVEEKFPDIRAIREENEQELSHVVEMMTKLLKSATDDRYKRSLPEWGLIVKEALEKSPRAAAKKYSGLTPDGKEVRLSVESIRKTIPEVQNFFSTFGNYMAIFVLFIAIVIEAVRQDPELMAAWTRFDKEYEESVAKPTAESTYHHDDNEERQKNNGDEPYEYFVVRHYDPELRRKQKLDRKRGIRSSKACDGKIEHRVQEKDILPDVLQKLRQKPYHNNI